MNWKNADNIGFYDEVSMEYWENYLSKSGPENGIDIQKITSYVTQAKTILEVGAGYGRVLDLLKQYEGDKQLTAIERSERMCQILREKFGHSIHLFEEDLLSFQTDNSFDLILWMFGGIANFSQQEQWQVLQNLQRHLQPQGSLIIECIASSDGLDHAAFEKNQEYSITIDGSLLHVYIPCLVEIQQYAENLGFATCQCLPYYTSNGTQRNIYILSR